MWFGCSTLIFDCSLSESTSYCVIMFISLQWRFILAHTRYGVISFLQSSRWPLAIRTEYSYHQWWSIWCWRLAFFSALPTIWVCDPDTYSTDHYILSFILTKSSQVQVSELCVPKMLGKCIVLFHRAGSHCTYLSPVEGYLQPGMEMTVNISGSECHRGRWGRERKNKNVALEFGTSMIFLNIQLN